MNRGKKKSGNCFITNVHQRKLRPKWENPELTEKVYDAYYLWGAFVRTREKIIVGSTEGKLRP